MTSDWRDIEMAPKDGTYIIVAGHENMSVTVGHWVSSCDLWTCGISGDEIKPTHWMPLPNPPQPQGGDG